MILMYDTAARCSELLDMKVCDLRLDANTRLRICTEKGAKSAQSHCSARRFSIANNICASFIRPQITTVKHHFLHCDSWDTDKMSPDTVSAFFIKYGSMAKLVCPEVPEHIHPHMMRHTRAMHLYQSGMPMVLLSQYLGHAQVETTMIYAHADTEMKRAAIQKADAVRKAKPAPDEIWADNEEMILKLSGLT